MKVFVDTSAILAFLDADDDQHARATSKWRELLQKNETLITNNYIVLETVALLQHRFGIEAVRTFQEDIFPNLIIEWVDAELHQEGITAVLTADRKKLSLVDCISFAMMRRIGAKAAFSFDKHFAEQGFNKP